MPLPHSVTFFCKLYSSYVSFYYDLIIYYYYDNIYYTADDSPSKTDSKSGGRLYVNESSKGSSLYSISNL